MKQSLLKKQRGYTFTMDTDLVFRRCLHELRALEGVRGVVGMPPKARRGNVDLGQLRLMTEAGTITYLSQVKTHLSPATIGHTLVRLTNVERPRRALLLADYVPPTVSEIIEQRGIDYVDAAGNAHLRIPGHFFVHIRGNQRHTGDVSRNRSQLITSVGLQVVFALVTNRGILTPYRELAGLAGTSAAGVTRVVADLRQRGFLIERRGQPRLALERAGELIDLWASGYATQLRPKIVLQRFRAPGMLDEAVTKFREMTEQQTLKWVLTGAFGSDVLTQYLRGDRLSIIVEMRTPGSMTLPAWSPSAEGPITLLRSFSPVAVRPFKIRDGWPAAHPLLVYAELLADGRSRELEAAQTVREQYLQDLSGAA